MRGLSRVLNQFPKSVMEKKLLPALLEEMKDRDLLALILQNVFQMIKILPSGRRAFTDKVIPRLREVFLTGGGTSHVKGVAQERDLGKEAGLMTILQNIAVIVENCSGKEFKEGKPTPAYEFEYVQLIGQTFFLLSFLPSSLQPILLSMRRCDVYPPFFPFWTTLPRRPKFSL